MNSNYLKRNRTDEPTLRTGAGPYSTRQYVYLLICLILLMTAITTGFIYWQSNKFKKIEMLANDYNLSTILNCAQIKEEGQHIQSHGYELLAQGKLAKRWFYGGHFNLSTSFFLIKEKMDTIKESQRRYNHQEYAKTLKNADDLLSRLLVVKENVDFAAATDVEQLSEMLHQLGTFMDQLQRLHTIAYYYSMSVLLSKRPQTTRNIFLFLFSLGIIGFLLIVKILNLIKLAEEELDKYRRHLQEQVKERTSELTEANEKLKQEIIGHRLAEEEKNKLQSKLQRAQKMEAIGTLAGGVAHDLNNILVGLVSYPEMLLMEIPEESPLREDLLTIQKSGERAAAIVQDLLTLARRGVAVTEVVGLNHIISAYLKSPEHEKLKLYHSNVQIETNFETALLNILGSPVHLSKTVMNLVSNAAEAMPNGGTVFISTENRSIDRPIRGYEHVDEGDYVTLRVSDNGMGFSLEDTERIFEPFYTKKVMGRSGTGLGMGVVWGTVKDHKGYIDIKSTEGKGTTFTLYFPISRKELASDKSLSSIEDYMGKGESVLVVDDVEEQRDIAFRILNKLNYSVTSVSSGEEAVDYMKNNTADLLVVDMIMDPGIDGLDTYKEILELHPGQKAIIASGFSETERVREAQRMGAGAYIKKPYLFEKIGIAVRNELDK